MAFCWKADCDQIMYAGRNVTTKENRIMGAREMEMTFRGAIRHYDWNNVYLLIERIFSIRLTLACAFIKIGISVRIQTA